MRLKYIGILLVALTLAGLSACGSNSTTTNNGKCAGGCNNACGKAGGGCGADIAAKYDNVAMVFFHSDN